MKNVCLVNGSLRGEKAASLAFLRDVDRNLPDGEFHKTCITVRARLKGSYSDEVLAGMAAADAIVLIFPLHNYGLPGALARLLEDYYSFIVAGNPYNREARVYAIVNCGYPRPEVTAEAVRVIKNFCRRLSLNWRFAVRIGGGPAVVVTKGIPFLGSTLRKAWAEMASDIGADDDPARSDHLIRPAIPEPILLMIKSYYERKGKMIERDYRRSQTNLDRRPSLSG